MRRALEDITEREGDTRDLLPDRVIVTLLAVYGIAVLAGLLLVSLRFLPAEDAVILYQYSRNLAAHGSITYYAGGPHTEGATDFGWMLLLAAGMRIGISPTIVTSVVNFTSILLLGLALLRIAKVKRSFGRVLVLAGAAGLFPQIVAAFSGFSVLPEALLLTWFVAAVVDRRPVLSPVLALVLCLFRPDGVLFAVPLLVTLLVSSDHRFRRLCAVIGLFIVPGLLYFAWRAHYFGQLLPLPFLVKADAQRSLGLFVSHSVSQSLKYLLVATVPIVLLLRWHRVSPYLVISLLVVPTLFYWAMRLDQNVGDRFFFYIPLATAILIALSWRSVDQQGRSLLLRTGFVATLLLMQGPLWREIRTFRDYQFRAVQEIARGLARSPGRGTVLTSEAGYLAYESGWIAYDAWGLNTAQFARRLVQPEDVASLRPDLIVLHPDVPSDCLPNANWPHYTDRTWGHMVRNVVLGAHASGTYELWRMSYGSEFYRLRRGWGYGEGDQECFFVNRASPDYRTMVSLLKQHHARLDE